VSTILALAALATIAAPGPGAAGPPEKGIAIGLFAEDAGYDYAPRLAEMKALGATHVEIAWVWWQDDVRSDRIRPIPKWTAEREQVLATLRAARALDLHVTAFPILRLVRADKNEWRGRIQPSDEDAWWTSYAAFIADAAKLARLGDAQRLAIGSELVSRESMRARWCELIDRLHGEAPGLELLYSANWDHFTEVSFWDRVDVVGLTAYFEVGRRGSSEDALALAWRPIRERLESFARRLGRPFVITEIGYPSQSGGTAWPWDQTRFAAIDLEEQRRGYQAFVQAWSKSTALGGVYWWNWFGDGGPADREYTPRNKPAQEVIRRWYRGP
jgi:hypothetical protein